MFVGGPQLHLSLQRTRVSDAGLTHLRELTGLRYLNVAQTNVSALGAAELRRALPNCQVCLQVPADVD